MDEKLIELNQENRYEWRRNFCTIEKNWISAFIQIYVHLLKNTKNNTNDDDNKNKKSSNNNNDDDKNNNNTDTSNDDSNDNNNEYQ